MLGIEHNVVPVLHLVVGGELFHHFRSPKPEGRVLRGDMLASYWSNFSKAYDDFENQVKVCSG